jgi:ferric-dicitrate binding protein FerR (iron transport regulator)
MSQSDAHRPAVRVSDEALASFRAASAEIIKETVSRSMARQDEVTQHGAQAQQLLTAGLEFTTRMLDAAMATGEIPMLEDELSWARDRLPHDGVAPEHVLSRLTIYRDVVSTLLPAHLAGEVTGYIDWMIARQRQLL